MRGEQKEEATAAQSDYGPSKESLLSRGSVKDSVCFAASHSAFALRWSTFWGRNVASLLQWGKVFAGMRARGGH
jgi:hypothetical protein